jgi:hypothetical protein
MLGRFSDYLNKLWYCVQAVVANHFKPLCVISLWYKNPGGTKISISVFLVEKERKNLKHWMIAIFLDEKTL